MPPQLLAADEPDPVEVVRPDGASPIFITADHAGRVIPRKLNQLGVSDSEMERHIAWDIGIAGVTRRLSAALDATAVLQAYSRLVIDCNRNPDWATAMPTISELTPIPGNENLSTEDREMRVREIFTPYHDRIRALMDARDAAGRRTVFVAMHSFTPVFKGNSRAMHVGVLYNKDTRTAGVMLDLLRAEPDLVVGDNAPYSITNASDYGIPNHGDKRGIAHVELEIRQDLIADEAGQAAWADRLARILPRMLERIG